MTNALQRDPITAHYRAVDLVAEIAPPSKDWVALRGRLEAFTAADTTIRDRLVSAVVNGGDDDVPVLTALAVAEASELGQRGPVVAAVRRAVLARLLELYSKTAAANYRAVAKEFDTAAANFADVAGQCDPETDAASMVEATDQTRQAWIHAAIFAHRLDKLVPVLRAAATLANVPSSAHRDLGGADACLLPLICDPAALHRRRVWEAFAAKGRCGRWSALVALGARIRAWPAAELADFGAYRQPRPLERRIRPAHDGGLEQYWLDPEDPGFKKPEPEPKPRRVRQLAR